MFSLLIDGAGVYFELYDANEATVLQFTQMKSTMCASWREHVKVAIYLFEKKKQFYESREVRKLRHSVESLS